MKGTAANQTLGQRIGRIVHTSPLRMKVRRLMIKYPAPGVNPSPEDWLVDTAISRGLNQFVRDSAAGGAFTSPTEDDFPLHELVVALCYTGGLDRPQMIRMAGLLIKRYEMDMPALTRLAELERVEVIFAELANAGLRCDPEHPRWQKLRARFSGHAGTSSPVIHWSRLAETPCGPIHEFYHGSLAT